MLNKRASNTHINDDVKKKPNQLCYRIKQLDNTFLGGICENNRCFTLAFKERKTAEQFLHSKLEMDAYIVQNAKKQITKRPERHIEIDEMPLDYVIHYHRASNLDVVIFHETGDYEKIKIEPQSKIESFLQLNYIYRML